jgi:C4-dicarboxylate-specific signal transduction histidine kinase
VKAYVSDKEVEPNFSSPVGGILSGRFMSSKSVCLGSVLAVLLPIGMAQAETPQRHKRWGIAEADVPSERVIGDRIQIQQVPINLLLNAVDAVADEQEPRGSVTVSLPKSQDTASIQVSDTGHGISEGAKTRKFDSFCSTKPTGIGLGLSIVRTLVESHGGTVWAEKRPGGGATFHVDLQACKMPRREAA